MNYEEFVKMNEQGGKHWWYAARAMLLKQELEKTCSYPNDFKILDLASACGDNFTLCPDYGKVFGVDISWQAIRYCKQRNITTIVQGDVQKLPFKSNSYDLILALDVFEHLQDDVAAMKEIRRVLKYGGKLIFNTPAFMFLFSYHDVAFHHLRRYRACELREKMDLAKLQVKFMTYWSFFIFPAVYVMRKISNTTKENYAEILSDFHREINPLAEKVLKFFSYLELILIKLNISLPLGVSIYGIARKDGEEDI